MEVTDFVEDRGAVEAHGKVLPQRSDTTDSRFVMDTLQTQLTYVLYPTAEHGAVRNEAARRRNSCRVDA